jgi:DNA-binding GntR family transcriptional regulator
MQTTAVRPNLSHSIADELRERIVDGRLPAGEAINEVHLAAELGVSRTPLREALFRLVAEGTIESHSRRGFFVRSLSVDDFEQIYAIRPLLDPEALRLAGLPRPPRLARLAALNQKMREATRLERILALDDQWHLELLADCPNRVLVGLIEQFIRRTRCYELALMRECRNRERAITDHREIIAALRRRDLEAACAALKRNMQHGREPILAWLRERDAEAHTGSRRA